MFVILIYFAFLLKFVIDLFFCEYYPRSARNVFDRLASSPRSCVDLIAFMWGVTTLAIFHSLLKKNSMTKSLENGDTLKAIS